MKDFKDIALHFEPQMRERDIYEQWQKKDCFKPQRGRHKEPFTIVMPPPNITGQLHIGHALDLSMQDIAIRYKRMCGYETLYLPGTDHASIATEAKVVAKLRAEGKEKHLLGREAFLDEAWAWKDKYGSRIVEQAKRLGISCDWSRLRFTLDAGLSEAVVEAFCRLYEKGLIYRGERMINWCSDCGTSISDAETEYLESPGHFYHLAYPIVERPGEYLEIATTRPETMLGDTAVAVHPDDERYRDYVGLTCLLPLVGREIKIIADDYVERDFGTGCVKITPAHDPNDYEIGLKHDLEIIDVFTDDGLINELGGRYEGLTIAECRERIVEDLKESGVLLKVEDMQHNVSHCTRCHGAIEPRLSLQWWVAMKSLAAPAIAAAENGDIEFIPDFFNKTYLNWMRNIRDWCISRQLWWGHRIPAWYCQDCGHITVARKTPENCEACGSRDLIQDEDTLDTWFSSALWPFSTLGWPHQTDDYKRYYPNQLLITGYDILPLWVSRMIFSGLEYTGELPFAKVGIHGIVRDELGRKMSKSLDNGIDPVEVIDQSGTDSLRYALFNGTAVGKDMRFYQQKVEAGRNFMNKLWNAMRFFRMNLKSEDQIQNIEEIDRSALAREDKWLLDHLFDCIEDCSRHYESLDFSLALDKIVAFAWDLFCDWYLEMSKERLKSEDEREVSVVLSVMNFALTVIVKLLHPIMPFVTEEIYAELKHEEGLLITSSWPQLERDAEDQQATAEVDLLLRVIRGVRTARADLNVPAQKIIRSYLQSSDQNVAETVLGAAAILSRLAKIEEIERVDLSEDLAKSSHAIVLPELTLYLPLADLIDTKAELERLQSELAKVSGLITAQEKKLANQNFVSRAPAHVVAAERSKLEEYEALKSQHLNHLEQLKELS